MTVPAEIAVRPIVEGDSPVVARLVHALLTELGATSVRPLSDMEMSARTVLTDALGHGFLAFADDEPIGVILLSDSVAVYAGGRFGVITELYVSPPHRSSGVAALLVRAAEALGRTRGWERLEVGAPPQPAWDRTLRFYLKDGFTEVGPRLRKLL